MESIWRAGRVLLGLILRRPIVGVCILPILPDGKVVLIRRQDSGRWGFPGGLVDWGENILTATQRELEEETGLDVSEVGRLVGVYSAPNRDSRFHSICIALEVRVMGTPVVNDPAEVAAIASFAWTDLAELDMAHDHAQHVEDYLAKRTVIA
ncbi:NUDIX hydrolase [Oscillatoria sp. CS-180]|uniref:NUDIX hydrolase n=1 Tax=Oscillatoria sp. CS-180 TaxID=3021720 RepID=UPI00232D9F35|nr:NUDIX hydrolase [Oscillatoria sp. CS-180]MDB9527991.1 NUDIX hydrolase [Oscillatoria sp. CS-180]